MASAWLRHNASKTLARVEYRPSGKGTKPEPYTGYLDKKKALEKLKELKGKLALEKDAGKPLAHNAKLSEVLARWSESRIAGGHAKRSWTMRAKGEVEKLAKARGWKTLADITTQDLDAWVRERVGVKADMTSEEIAVLRLNGIRGMRMPLTNLRAVLTWARAIEKLAIDEAVLAYRVARGPRRKRHQLLTVPEVGRILVEALRVGGASVATAFEHMALYACRPVDVCRLKVRNWDAARGEITYRGTYAGDGTKNGEYVTHVCHAAHAEKISRLAQGRQPDEALFLDGYGRPWELDKNDCAAAMCKWYKKHCGKVAAPAQPQIYHLKRFAMTRLKIAARGNNVLVIAMSGHLTPAIVDTYAQSNEEVQRELIAAIPMITASADSIAPVEVMEAVVVDTSPLVTPDAKGFPIAQHTGGKRAGSGFASLSPEKRREIAQRAYAKALASGKLHRFTSAEAKAAAKLGGFAVMDPRRRLIAQTIGQETAKELGLAFNTGTGKAAREAQLDAELIVIEEDSPDAREG